MSSLSKAAAKLYERIQAVQTDERPRPLVVLLEAGFGHGKTYALQQVYDALADADEGAYWTPGLVPQGTPSSDISLRRDRKRINARHLCHPTGAPSWLWLGVSCAGAEEQGGLAGSTLASLGGQVEFHLEHMRVREESGSEILRGVWEIAGGLLQWLDPVAGSIGAVKAAVAGGKRVASAISSDHDLVDARLIERALDEYLSALRALGGKGFPLVIALDDAHQASPSVLAFLSKLLTNGPKADQSRRYFDIAAPTADVPVVVVLATWPTRERFASRGLDEWLDELVATGVDFVTLAEADGWYPQFLPTAAQSLLRSHHPWLHEEDSAALTMKVTKRGAVSPLMTMTYVARVENSWGQVRPAQGKLPPEWIDSLPESPEGLCQERLERLSDHAMLLAQLGSLVGLRFPGDAVARALSRALDQPDFPAALEEAVAHGYLRICEEIGVGSNDLRDPEDTATLRFYEFADDLDQVYVRSLLDHKPWMSDLLGQCCEAWLNAVMTYYARDLEVARPEIEFGHLRGAIEIGAEAYLEAQSQGRLQTPMEHLVFASLATTAEPTTESIEWANAVLAHPPEKGRREIALAALLVAETALWDGSLAVAVVEALDMALVIAPKSRLAVSIARIVLKGDRGVKCRDKSLSIMSENRGYPTAALLLARELVLDGERAEAITVLKAVGDDATVSLTLARLLIEDGERAEAITVLKAVGDNATVSLALARLLIEDGERAEAITVLKAVGDNAYAVLMLARLLIEDGERAEAKELLATVKHFGRVAITLARLLEEDGERAEAKELLATMKHFAHAAIMLARLLDEDGERAEAVKVLGRVKDNPVAATKLAELLEEDGERTEAKELLAPMKHFADVAIMLARLLDEDGERAEAVKVLRRLEADPNASIKLAELLDEDGERAEAVKVLGRVKDDPMAAIKLAELLTEDGERAEAIKVLGRVRDDQMVAIKLAILWSHEAEFQKAASLLRPYAAEQYLAALLLARNACDQIDLDYARACLEDLLDRYRGHIHWSLLRATWSEKHVARVFPDASPRLDAFHRFLHHQGREGSWKAAGLYGVIAREYFPKRQSDAVRMLLPRVPEHPYCACVLASLPLPQRHVPVLLQYLHAHAEDGNRNSVTYLASLAVKSQDTPMMRVALTLLESFSEYSTDERDLLVRLNQRVGGLAVEFLVIRQDLTPDGPLDIWEPIV